MATRVTLTTNDKTTTHEIDMHGTAGAAFWCIVIGTLIFVVGYSTTGWYHFGNAHYGIWEACTCYSIQGQDWHSGVQAMTTIGLIGLILSLILAALYMFVHNFSKNTVLILLVVCCFLSVLCILIGVIIYGVKMDGSAGSLHYSFAFAIIGMLITAAAGVLSVIQMKKSGIF